MGYTVCFGKPQVVEAEQSARLHLSLLRLEVHVDGFLKGLNDLRNDMRWKKAETALSVTLGLLTESCDWRQGCKIGLQTGYELCCVKSNSQHSVGALALSILAHVGNFYVDESKTEIEFTKYCKETRGPVIQARQNRQILHVAQ